MPMSQMKILDLFSGSGSFSLAFKDRGHRVTTIDIEEKFHPDIAMDVFKLTPRQVTLGGFDVVLASPPCTCFSVASIGTHWMGGKEAYIPKTNAAMISIALVEHTKSLVSYIKPRFFVMENPRGVLRKLNCVKDLPRETVWYCQYGDERAKPTDLFGTLPFSFIPKICHNGATDHASAPRGARSGTQGRNGAYERSKIPYNLSLKLCLAMELDSPC